MENLMQLEEPQKLELPSMSNEKLQKLEREQKEYVNKISGLEKERLQLEKERENAVIEFETLDESRTIGEATRKEVEKANLHLDEIEENLKKNSALTKRAKAELERLEEAIEEESSIAAGERRLAHIQLRKSLLSQMISEVEKLESLKSLFDASVMQERQEFKINYNCESLPRNYHNVPIDLGVWVKATRDFLKQS